MPLTIILDALRNSIYDQSNSIEDNPKSLLSRCRDVALRTWDLGFTAFGGPPVHFQIQHQRFVEGRGGKRKWVDEQTVCHVHLVVFPRTHTYWYLYLFTRLYYRAGNR